MRRQHFVRLAVAAGALLLTAASPAQDKGTVGVSMPTKSSARWISDGDSMVKSLKEKGYKADLQYAEDDIPNQLAQVENMITKKVRVLVIAAIDGTTLSNALQKAADNGIKVIAYDRLIRGSKNVDYYATFDNFQVGVQQAGSIVDALKLKTAKGPFNIELFGGSPDDNNAFFFYNGKGFPFARFFGEWRFPGLPWQARARTAACPPRSRGRSPRRAGSPAAARR